MMETTTKPDPVPIEAPERDESEELFDINNANVGKVEVKAEEEPGKEPAVVSESGGSGHVQTVSVSESGGSSQVQTISENGVVEGVEEANDKSKTTLVNPSTSRNGGIEDVEDAKSKTTLVNPSTSMVGQPTGIDVTVYSSNISVTTASLNELEEGDDLEGIGGNKVGEACEEPTVVEGALVQNNNLPPEQQPARPYSARRGGPFSRKKKKTAAEEEMDLLSSSEEEEDEQKSEESYPQMKLRRKTLLKIERLTDSDSRRSRDIMVSRGLSPPSSSDEENLHIGWLAFPVGSSTTRINKTHGQFRQRVMCTCVGALKKLVSPVTRVCRLCRNYKVYDVQSLQGSIKSDSRSESKKTK